VNEIIFLIEEAVEGGFTARALGESIFTDADTFDTIRQQVRDAVNCHFDEGNAPKVDSFAFCPRRSACWLIAKSLKR
jgi:hypothetical protein